MKRLLKIHFCKIQRKDVENTNFVNNFKLNKFSYFPWISCLLSKKVKKNVTFKWDQNLPPITPKKRIIKIIDGENADMAYIRANITAEIITTFLTPNCLAKAADNVPCFEKINH